MIDLWQGDRTPALVLLDALGIFPFCFHKLVYRRDDPMDGIRKICRFQKISEGKQEYPGAGSFYRSFRTGFF